VSLRSRVLAGLALIAVVLAVSAFVITRTTEAHLVDQVDAQLIAAAGPRGGGFPRPPFENGRPGAGRGDVATQGRLSSLYMGELAADGSVITHLEPNLTEADPPLPEFDDEDLRERARGGRPFTVGSTRSDMRYRALVSTGRFGSTTVLALPLRDVDNAVGRLITVEIVATAAILAVLGLVAWWVIRLGVRPIKQMTATAASIAGGELSHRVPEASPGTEAGALGVALNQMLGRIEESFDERARVERRLRQFVADASHELRTPVTTIRGYAELYRSGGLADGAELTEAMRRTEQEAIRMGSLVEDLLHLARLDEGRPLQRQRVDLVALAEDAVRDARAVDAGRPITAHTNGPLVVTGDEARLRQVIANLIGNALVHTPPGTPVDVRVMASADRAVVEIEDRGPGMSDDVAARAFERFYRADPSRSRHRGGTGLGLAIVDATVKAHGGEVGLRTVPGVGTTVRIELPGDG
jgi:two-component system OmpR family sensor kinase